MFPVAVRTVEVILYRMPHSDPSPQNRCHFTLDSGKCGCAHQMCSSDATDPSAVVCASMSVCVQGLVQQPVVVAFDAGRT